MTLSLPGHANYSFCTWDSNKAFLHSQQAGHDSSCHGVENRRHTMRIVHCGNI